MSLSQRYQDFGGPTDFGTTSAETDLEELEDQKLHSFEAGYAAGWEDAIKAQSDDRNRVSAELSQNLQQMSFTYHEATSKLTASLRPFLRQIVEKLLPTIAHQTIGAHVVEQIESMALGQINQPVEIAVAPQNEQLIKALAGEAISEPFSVVVEPSMGAGQVFVRIGQKEREVNLDAAITDVAGAVDAFFHDQREE